VSNFQFARALNDLKIGTREWRFWLLLGWSDLTRQYRRSFLGPVWISLNTAAFVLAFGVIGSKIFSIDIKEFLPYFAAGNIFYWFLASFVSESTAVFPSSAQYIRHGGYALSLFVYRFTTRCIFTLAHNFVIILVVIYWSGEFSQIKWGAFFLALGLASAAGFFLSGVLATFAARFRDVPLMLASVMQFMFFLTPVFWRPSQLPADLKWVVEVNPLAVFLDLLRQPIMGQYVEWRLWQSGLTIVFFTALLYFIVLAYARRRVVFWV
jgi:ABC-type polysaccharide/polyol phosphate export permease